MMHYPLLPIGGRGKSLRMSVGLFPMGLIDYMPKKVGKNAHTPHELLTTGQKTPLTFLLANLLLKLFTTAKLILQLVTR